jgi:hypothetical protein
VLLLSWLTLCGLLDRLSFGGLALGGLSLRGLLFRQFGPCSLPPTSLCPRSPLAVLVMSSLPCRLPPLESGSRFIVRDAGMAPLRFRNAASTAASCLARCSRFARIICSDDPFIHKRSCAITTAFTGSTMQTRLNSLISISVATPSPIFRISGP